MTRDKDNSEIKSGLTRRAAIGGLAAAVTVLPTLRDAANAQTWRRISQQPIARLPLASAQPTARTAHTATLLQNGLLLVVGGMQFTIAPLSGAQLFNPVRGAWHNAASMQASRSDHAAALLPDGRVLICGGVHAGGRPMAVCEIYDPQNDAWHAAAPLNIARYGHAATPLSNGTILVTGGCGNRPIAGVEIYDPARDAWKILDITPEIDDIALG